MGEGDHGIGPASMTQSAPRGYIVADRVIEIEVADLWKTTDCPLYNADFGRCNIGVRSCDNTDAAPQDCPLREGRVVIQARGRPGCPWFNEKMCDAYAGSDCGGCRYKK